MCVRAFVVHAKPTVILCVWLSPIGDPHRSLSFMLVHLFVTPLICIITDQ